MSGLFRSSLRRVVSAAVLAVVSAIAFAGSATAQPTQTITICKKTLPAPDPSNTSFAFTWANGSGAQTAVPLKDGECHVYDVTNMDKFNKFAEVVPAGWTLSSISCTKTTTPLQIIGANSDPGFQPGDNMVSMDLNEANVTCMFINRRVKGGGELPKDKGYLQIEKIVNDLTGGTNLSGYTFPIEFNCSNFAPPTTWLTLPLAANTSSTNNPAGPGYSGLPPSQAGITCTVRENGGNPLPPIYSKRCGGGPSAPNASWTTTYSPNPTATTGSAVIPGYGATATLTVTNTLTCNRKDDAKTNLIIGKLYSHPGGMMIPSGVTFNFTLTCTNPANTATITQTGSMTSPTFSPIMVSTVPAGWKCTVTETVPSGTINGCFWSPGIPVTPMPLTIQPAPATNMMGIKNNYICVPPNQNYDVDVIKVRFATSSGGQLGFVITVQNVGNLALSATDLGSGHLKVIDSLPAGSTIVSGIGSSSSPGWSCASLSVPQTPTIECTYVGGAGLAQFAALPQIEIFAIPTNNATTYYSPANGSNVTANPSGTTRWNCAVVTLTGTAGHDDQTLGNNSNCIGF